MISKATLDRKKIKMGELVYAAKGTARTNVIICLTHDCNKNKIQYIPLGTIGIVIFNNKGKNVKVAWANGTVGWVYTQAINFLNHIDN